MTPPSIRAMRRSSGVQAALPTEPPLYGPPKRSRSTCAIWHDGASPTSRLTRVNCRRSELKDGQPSLVDFQIRGARMRAHSRRPCYLAIGNRRPPSGRSGSHG